MGDRVRAIARKEMRELSRDPVYLGLAFGVPLILLLLLGYGLSMDVRALPVAVVDHDGSVASREYIDGFVHSDYFRLVGVLRSAAEARDWIRAGRARVVVDIPSDFARRLAANRRVAVGITVDGSFPIRGEVAVGYVEAVSMLYNERLLRAWLEAHAPAAPTRGAPLEMNVSVWYNPTLESKNFMVPSMLVVIMMIFPPLLSALLIVRERESGTILNLYSSPASRWDILAGKAAPYVVVSFLDYLVIFLASVWLFQVRFVGSAVVLSAAALLYSTCTIGIGLLISSATRTQLAAVLATFIGVVAPAFTFSGIFTPTATLGPVGQAIGRVIPATYFVGVVRGSYLKGGGLAPYAADLLALAVYAAVVYLAAWLFLKKRVG